MPVQLFINAFIKRVYETPREFIKRELNYELHYAPSAPFLLTFSPARIGGRTVTHPSHQELATGAAFVIQVPQRFVCSDGDGMLVWEGAGGETDAGMGRLCAACLVVGRQYRWGGCRFTLRSTCTQKHSTPLAMDFAG